MTNWRPINTAPKDGTYILTFNAAAEIPAVLCWWDKAWRETDAGPDWTHDEREPWTGTPLYWMPLPNPPKG